MENTGQEGQTVAVLLNRISELAMMWRGQPENRKTVEAEYHETYQKLRTLGWDDTLDVDYELPDEQMPKEYVAAHPHVPSTLPWPTGWRTSPEIEKIEKLRQQRKKSLLQKLKEWLT